MTPAELQQGIADLIEENRRLRKVIAALLPVEVVQEPAKEEVDLS